VPVRKLHNLFTGLVLFSVFWGCLTTIGDAGQRKQTSQATTVFETTKDSIFTIATDKSSGTGFLCLDSKTVATCYHVIEGARTIKIIGTQGAVWAVSAVRFDKKTDLALLTIDRPSSRRKLKLNTRKPTVGQSIFVIGTALGVLTNSLSEGIVSGQRSTGEASFVQITASISPGISGAPVLNSNGDVVAIVSGTLSRGQNLNLGISSYQLEQVLRQKSVRIRELQSKALSNIGQVVRPKRTLSENEAKLLARLLNQVSRSYVDVSRRLCTPKERISSAAAFSRYWNTNSSEILTFGPWPELTNLIDVFESKLTLMADSSTEWAELSSKSGNSKMSTEETSAAVETYTSATSALTDSWYGLKLQVQKRFSTDELLIKSLSGPALFRFFRQADVTDEIFGKLVPDYSSRDCIIACPILLEDGVEKVLADQSRTFEENVDYYAVAKAGARIFSASLAGDKWELVRDWTSFYKLTEGARGNTVRILVGTDLASAIILMVKIGQ